MTLWQTDTKTLSDAWERFKKLMQKCPHHSVSHCVQMKTFYAGLNKHPHMLGNTFVGGAKLNKTYNVAYTILVRMTGNNYEWGNREDKDSRILFFKRPRTQTANQLVQTLTMQAIAPDVTQVNAIGCQVCKTELYQMSAMLTHTQFTM